MAKDDIFDPRALWQIGVEAVRGGPAVAVALAQRPDFEPDRIIAIGKAACDMARPALEAYPGAQALIVTKHGHVTDMPRLVPILSAGHPIPDAASLQAGAALLRFVQASPPESRLLVLMSGGASAVAELLPAGTSLQEWQAHTDRLIASGADIHQINAVRRETSRIKGGKLLARFPGQAVRTLAISDVQGDALEVIGSGLGCAPDRPSFAFDAQIIASNAHARTAIVAALGTAPVINTETLYGDVEEVADRVAADILSGPDGVYLYGGEPTVDLPPTPGRGGRNQALGLRLARHIAGREDIEIVVAGTDGTDGPTQDAGALIDGRVWGTGAADALARADAGTYLAAHRALLRTGPTGTNVMDLLVARKAPPQG